MPNMLMAYIEAALWSSTDESRDDGGDPLDKNYTQANLSPCALAQMTADVEAFWQQNTDDITEGSTRERCDLDRAGHDFWLTRNRHGAGFWDGDWPEPAATRLTESACKFGEVNLYIGDDGRIYHSPCNYVCTNSAEDRRCL